MTSEVARRLIRAAAQLAPDPLSERLREEWLADLCVLSGTWSRLRFAIGCYWAARVIAQEHAVSLGPVAPPAIEPRHAHFIRFPQDAAPVLMSGTTTFVLILSLNAAVFYGLLIGLIHT